MSDNKKLSQSLPKLGRRKLLKGAAGAAPLLVTLASRPAWGGNVCWSGIQSGNVSGHRNEECIGGRTPDYYKIHVAQFGTDPGWPTNDPLQNKDIDSGCTDLQSDGTINPETCQVLFANPNATNVPGTKLGELFWSAQEHPLANMTLMQVLHQHEQSFSFHAIATYFNALNFDSFIFRPDQALAIINDIYQGGQHMDATGRVWTEQQVKNLFDASNNA